MLKMDAISLRMKMNTPMVQRVKVMPRKRNLELQRNGLVTARNLSRARLQFVISSAMQFQRNQMLRTVSRMMTFWQICLAK